MKTLSFVLVAVEALLFALQIGYFGGFMYPNVWKPIVLMLALIINAGVIGYYLNK